jgi:tyrosinase
MVHKQVRGIEDTMTMQRMDINALNNNELADYIHALNILRARSEQNPDDETGYDFQAGLHNGVFRDDEFIACEHGSDLFLPWHRAHLHYFEQLLQAADPPRTANVTIPYWDWLHSEVNGRFPKAFSAPGLFKPGRNVNPAPGSPGEKLPADTLEIVTEETDWNAFGGFPEGHPTGNFGRLELGPHNNMHGFYISGLMGNPATAAQDPI